MCTRIWGKSEKPPMSDNYVIFEDVQSFVKRREGARVQDGSTVHLREWTAETSATDRTSSRRAVRSPILYSSLSDLSLVAEFTVLIRAQSRQIQPVYIQFLSNAYTDVIKLINFCYYIKYF